MPNIIGLDIGGTKISGIVYDGKKVVENIVAVTPASLEGFKRTVLKTIDFLSAKHKIPAVGISIAGRIDKGRGLVIQSPNLPYLRNFPLASLVASRGFGKVAIDNDASCFLLAEARVGQAKKYKDLFGIIIGTGVGGAMLLGGKMYRGKNNLGGEIGRWIINGEGLETQYQRCKKNLDFKALRELFAIALADITNLLSPECVVVGGTFGQLYHSKFLSGALKDAEKHVNNKKMMPKLLISGLKFAGAIGATLLFEKENNL